MYEDWERGWGYKDWEKNLGGVYRLGNGFRGYAGWERSWGICRLGKRGVYRWGKELGGICRLGKEFGGVCRLGKELGYMQVGEVGMYAGWERSLGGV